MFDIITKVNVRLIWEHETIVARSKLGLKDRGSEHESRLLPVLSLLSMSAFPRWLQRCV
jgi:hypothetical protein